MNKNVQKSHPCSIEIRLRLNIPTIPSRLSAVLQAGFGIETPSDVTVNDLLCREMNIDPLYVLQRITTIFVDGKCVDDTKTSVLRAGSTLALSSSMPGLAGAAVRSGNPLGLFRGPVTHDDKRVDKKTGGGIVHVKLFNVLIAELGPVFLARGIILGSSQALQILEACAGSSITLRLAGPETH